MVIFVGKALYEQRSVAPKCPPPLEAVQNMLSPCRSRAELLVRRAVRHYWVPEGVSSGGMGLWSGQLCRRRLLETDSEPQIRGEPHY